MNNNGYTFKTATENWEFDQIAKLNYETFVEEIPQHTNNHNRLLVDRFHHENTYFICLQEEYVVGMIAVRCKRPFSLDEKISNLDEYLPKAKNICEIRLLSVKKEHRNGKIFQGLANQALRFGLRSGFDMAVISGVTMQYKLYEKLGFKPFGPLTGTEKAAFQPMYLTLDSFREKLNDLNLVQISKERNEVNLLPGPLKIRPIVHESFTAPAISHRSKKFMADFQELKRKLCEITRAKYVEILTGSGSLANDVIAAHLSLEKSKGLVLSNGEFGDRLIDQSRRAGLDYISYQLQWGDAFNYQKIEKIINENPDIKWLWAVHAETSTGILNSIEKLQRICLPRGIKICLDCVSSIGNVPVSLENIYLASCVSGKGLSSYTGLAMVFYNHHIFSAPDDLPRYFDLGFYASYKGVPFTISSNLVYALRASVENIDFPSVIQEKEFTGKLLRKKLREKKLKILAPDQAAFWPVINLIIPPQMNSELIGDILVKEGFLLSYRSEYLLKRNWIQICLMSDYSAAEIERLYHTICHLIIED
jgi:aspartate aminotransferase-like enzyme/predicted N-acetyltransferase YhbS